jgi:hypothetical protein
MSGLGSFNARWNILMDDVDCLDQFRKRVLHAVDRLAGEFLLAHPQLADEMLYRLADGPPREFKGQLAALGAKLLTGPDTVFTRNDQVYRLLDKAASKSDLIRVLQHIFWILEEGRFPHLAELAVRVDRAATELPFIGIRVARRRGGAIIYPAGVRVLDDRVINETLDWLESYPKVVKQFSLALEIYLTDAGSKRGIVLDRLRHSLEQLLRALLSNRKSLENQKDHLLPWLKARHVNQEVVSMFAVLLEKFAKYQNDAVKHDDKSAAVEVDFMIYLTGAFMRFLLEVERNSEAKVEKLKAFAAEAGDVATQVTESVRAERVSSGRVAGRRRQRKTKGGVRGSWR